MTKLNTQTYDVEIKAPKVDVCTESKHEYAEDGKIVVGQKIHVTDTVDTHAQAESTPDGTIKPYGLDAGDGAYDVEVKEQVADSVVQEHIATAITTETQKDGVHD